MGWKVGLLKRRRPNKNYFSSVTLQELGVDKKHRRRKQRTTTPLPNSEDMALGKVLVQVLGGGLGRKSEESGDMEKGVIYVYMCVYIYIYIFVESRAASS